MGLQKVLSEIKEAIQDENSTLTFSKAAELRGLNEEEQHKALEIIKQKMIYLLWSLEI